MFAEAAVFAPALSPVLAPVFDAAVLPLIAAGLGVGLVVGLTGVGGGSLMTPILIFFFGIPVHLAVGTDLLFAAFTRLGGTVNLARTRQVDWPIAGWLALGSLPTALAVLAWLRHTGPALAPTQALMGAFLGLALLLTAAATLATALRSGPVQIASTVPKILSTDPAQPRHWLLPVLLGAAIGALVSVSSVGAGAIGVAVLMLLYPLLPLPRIASADVAHAVPLTLVAGLGHAAIGSVDWLLLGKLLAGSLPGIWLGLLLANKAPQWLQPVLPWLRIALAVLLAGAGLIMLLR